MNSFPFILKPNSIFVLGQDRGCVLLCAYICRPGMSRDPVLTCPGVRHHNADRPWLISFVLQMQHIYAFFEAKPFDSHKSINNEPCCQV